MARLRRRRVRSRLTAWPSCWEPALPTSFSVSGANLVRILFFLVPSRFRERFASADRRPVASRALRPLPLPRPVPSPSRSAASARLAIRCMPNPALNLVNPNPRTASHPPTCMALTARAAAAHMRNLAPAISAIVFQGLGRTHSQAFGMQRMLKPASASQIAAAVRRAGKDLVAACCSSHKKMTRRRNWISVVATASERVTLWAVRLHRAQID